VFDTRNGWVADHLNATAARGALLPHQLCFWPNIAITSSRLLSDFQSHECTFVFSFCSQLSSYSLLAVFLFAVRRCYALKMQIWTLASP
jgi:hypothetical protein